MKHATARALKDFSIDISRSNPEGNKIGGCVSIGRILFFVYKPENIQMRLRRNISYGAVSFYMLHKGAKRSTFPQVHRQTEDILQEATHF